MFQMGGTSYTGRDHCIAQCRSSSNDQGTLCSAHTRSLAHTLYHTFIQLFCTKDSSCTCLPNETSKGVSTAVGVEANAQTYLTGGTSC